MQKPIKAAETSCRGAFCTVGELGRASFKISEIQSKNRKLRLQTEASA